jgi:hypothetical protein
VPIPDRLRPPNVTTEELGRYCNLCKKIERAIERSQDEEVQRLMVKWDRRCARREPKDFVTYYKAIDREVFVGEAMLGVPAVVSDLTYTELQSVIAVVREAVELAEDEQSWYEGWLETNFPGANFSDLLYWPNHWFGDESLLHAEFTDEQLLRYAMLWSGRVLPDAPVDVPLPYPIPAL